MQAVIGRCQLQRLDEMNKQRRTIADEFRNAFAGEKNIGLPEILPGATPVYPTFPVTVPSHRSKLAARLQAEGIDCSEGFIPDCTALSYCGGGESSAPGAAYLADRVLHLPVYPALDEEEIGMIADIVPRVLKNV
jgi:dTDP-4-amino-4,6-dideoxygalactose transaminase